MSFADEMRKKAKAVVEEAERVKDIQIVDASYEKIDDKIKKQAEKGNFHVFIIVARDYDPCSMEFCLYQEEDIDYVVDGIMNPAKAIATLGAHYREQGFTVRESSDGLNIGWE